MVFFGFLKKKGIDAPTKPEGISSSADETAPKSALPPPPHSEEVFSSMPDPLADVPPLPDKAPLPDAPQPAPDNLTAFSAIPDAKLSDASQPPAVQPLPGLDAEPTPDAKLSDVSSSPAVQPLPGLDAEPTLDAKLSADVAPVPDDAPSSFPSPAEKLPDFTEDEIATAERMEQPVALAPHRSKEEPLPAFQDVEGTAESTLYVSASQYRDALRAIAKLKETARSGAAGLKSFDENLEEHKTPYLKFADTLNTVQEQLIAMDNMLLNQR